MGLMAYMPLNKIQIRFLSLKQINIGKNISARTKVTNAIFYTISNIVNKGSYGEIVLLIS